jgi:alpha-N-arabinofuranosidase
MLDRREFLKAASITSVAALASSETATAVEILTTVAGREYHVSPEGDDQNTGSRQRMLRTISAAANLAQPGDVITVHKGVYRERVDPPRGGSSEQSRIVYRAAPGEQVEITGAEIVKDWTNIRGDVWSAAIPNSFFGGFNPYKDLIHGDWFDPKNRKHHTGAVYLNGEWLQEAASLDEVFARTDATPLWFAQEDSENTTLWAQFRAVDPNEQLTEINVRKSVFYPSKPGMNYITVQGFIMRRAATPWAPPTAEQVGLIGTNWSKGWIIENNSVSYSVCSGIALGKHGDEFDNTSQDSAEGYVKTIERALKRGWSKEHIGGHVVCNNEVSHCEQAGIVGSLGAAFSLVTGNTIHEIHVRQLFTGAEMAGIKFHGAVDTEISKNNIYRTCRGLWLDWMAQGTHVCRNIFHENQAHDLFVEVDHGPFLVDNNVFLSRTSQRIVSQGGAYAHNLFCGDIDLNQFDARMTPFLKPHSTEIGGYHDNPSGDVRFYNNVFAQDGDLSAYDITRLPVFFSGNVFLKGAKPSKREPEPFVLQDFDPKIEVMSTDNGLELELMLDPAWIDEKSRKTVTTELLGRALITSLRFEAADGSPVTIARDFSGHKRNSRHPFPGPFEVSGGRKGGEKVRVLAAAQPVHGSGIRCLGRHI